MKNLNVNLIAIAVSLAFSAGSMAGDISENDYNTSKNRISAEYKSAKSSCAAFSGNRNDICDAEAKGSKDVALAELDASYKPSREASYQARVTKGEAGYAVALERCDDQSGNAKDVCIKVAKSAVTSVKADAEAAMKISAATATANEASVEARGDANIKTAEAREDAAEDKTEARYKVAKEKCDSYAGVAKDECLSHAKAHTSAE